MSEVGEIPKQPRSGEVRRAAAFVVAGAAAIALPMSMKPPGPTKYAFPTWAGQARALT